MKTKKLIELLNAADPSGERECVIGNADIHGVYAQESYWDGCARVMIRDPKLDGYYDIIGAKVQAKGTKVSIHTMDIDDMLLDDPDAPVAYDCEYAEKHYKDRVEKWRAENVAIRDAIWKGSVEKQLPEILEKINSGWKIVQPLDSTLGYCNSMWFLFGGWAARHWKDYNGVRSSDSHFKILNQGQCKLVLGCWDFYPVKSEHYYEWKYWS